MDNLRREDTLQESTWDHASVYQDRYARQRDFEAASSKLVELAGFTGKLNSRPAVLLDWLDSYNSHLRNVMKLDTFSMTAVSVDSNDLDAKSALLQASVTYGSDSSCIFLLPCLSGIADFLLLQL